MPTLRGALQPSRWPLGGLLGTTSGFGLIALTATALLSMGLVVGPDIDAGIFSAFGSALVHGAVPYVQIWDHKPPLTFLIYGLGQVVLPWLGQWPASWLTSVGVCVVAALLVRSMVERAYGANAGLPAALVAVSVLASPILTEGAVQTEQVGTLFATAALLSAAGADRRRNDVIVGIALALAALSSLQLAPAGLAILGVRIAAPGRRSRIGVAIATFAGAVFVLASVAAWLTAVGALGAAIDANVTYLVQYARLNAVTTPGYVPIRVLTDLLALLVGIVPLTLTSGVAIMQRRLSRHLTSPRARVQAAAWVWLGLTPVFLAIQGRWEPHYLLPLGVPLALVSVPGLAHLRRVRSTARTKLVRALVIALMAGSVAMAMALATLTMAAYPASKDLAHLAASWIDGHTTSGQTVLVWGFTPQVYALADRQPAGPDLYLARLTTPGYSTPAMVASYLDGLRKAPPTVIVDTSYAGPGQAAEIPLLRAHPVQVADGRNLDLMAPVRAWVAREYTEAATIGPWTVYEQRGPSASRLVEPGRIPSRSDGCSGSGQGDRSPPLAHGPRRVQPRSVYRATA
jgi:hypothetical protein